MNIKSYFEFEVRTTLVYTVAAILMAYVSFAINNTAFAALASVIALVVITYGMKTIWKIKEDAKWWLGNGAIVYIILWIIFWTILYNTYTLG